MNLDQLRSFVEVAQTGHFTRAAEHLHLAQPSLSRQISTLERELGVELFHRVRGNVALTSAGERLLPLARRMLADADTARNEMAELAGLRRGRIRLGATPTLCTSLVAEVIAEFHERYPGVDIEILERGSRTLLSALMEGALDLALIVTSVSSGEARAVLDREPILSERLVVVSAASRPDPFGTASPDHGRGLELSELAAVPQIAFPVNYDLRVAMDAAYGAAGLTPVVAVEGVEMDAALRFAERGIGVAVVPAMVAVDRPALRATPLAGNALTRTVSLARRSDMAPTHASAALQALVREIADRLTSADSATGALLSRVS
ncbi:putative lysR-family transcriptional regulator [Leucobacter sp. 7(1)]|uniref:LysR family transcriptional regulator n=1 Tax=Leucobacter sp. 7(1) TaxID=1255613 RepID=UPI00097EBFCC|nr:LysR substrate-binding domain-containing protein [Leucobacter sp. 7(1)]SJN07989.1 putative lysR-family transcriptional regulator [Leucobacter sp. 7(1)]